MVNIIDLEYAMINFLLETPYIYTNLRINKEAFTDVIARNYFSFIGMTYTTTGTFIVRTHTERFLNTDGIIKMLNTLEREDISTVDSFLEYIGSFGTTKTFDAVENVLLDSYTRRKSIEVAEQIVGLAKNQKLSASEIVRKSSSELDKLLYQQSRDLITMSTYDIMQAELAQLSSGKVQSYTPIGINVVDEHSGGVPEQSLIVTIAANKQGKSMMLYKNALGGLLAGKCVMLCTVETSDVETRKKMLSLYSGIEYKKISTMEMTQSEKDIYRSKVIEFNDLYSDNFFLMYNNSGMSCKDIEVQYDKYKRAGITLNMLVVDYMGLLKPSDPKSGKTDGLLSLPQELRVLSQKTNTIVCTAQQLHSTVSTMDISEINESKIFFISTLSHEATMTLVLHSKDGEDETKVKVLRSRITSTDQIYCFYDKDFDKCNLGEDTPWYDDRF